MEFAWDSRGETKLIQRRIFISGKVQGVGFRASTIQAAKKYQGLRGFVRNLLDGRVEAVFSGEKDEVHSMVRWCKHGPNTANVQQVEVEIEEFDPQLELFKMLI